MTSIGIGNQFNELVKVTLSEKQAMTDQTDNNVQMIDESAKSQDFFQDNNQPGKKNNTTWIKSRNFLSDIAYVGINKEDFYNNNFIFDVYMFLPRTWIHFFWTENLRIRTTMKWSTCYGRTACHRNSTRTFARRKIFLTLIVRMFCSQNVLKLSLIFWVKIKRTTKIWEKTCLSTRTFSSMCTQMCFQRSIALLNVTVSTLKVTSTLYLRQEKTRGFSWKKF